MIDIINRKFSYVKFLFRSQLPARATRLLSRRLQTTNNSPLSQTGSESPRSLDSIHSRNTPSKTSLREHLKQRQQINLQSQLLNSSSEDLVADKTLRNSMLQDVACFKEKLIHLRRILQEVSRAVFSFFVTGYGICRTFVFFRIVIINNFLSMLTHDVFIIIFANRPARLNFVP